MAEPGDMQFKHTFLTKEKMDNTAENVFSSQIKSYIADGESAFKEEEAERQRVLVGVKKTLREEMREANIESAREAAQMKSEHEQLQKDMRAALARVKEASRQKILLKAQLYADKSEEAANGDAESVDALEQMEKDRRSMTLADGAARSGNEVVRDQHKASISENLKAGVAADATEITREAVQQQVADLNTITAQKNRAKQGAGVRQKSITSMIKAFFMKSKSQKTQKALDRQTEFVNATKKQLQDKAKAWNIRRKNEYENHTFRDRYNAFDEARTRYHILSRSGPDTAIMPQKDVKEYVGEFDVSKLDITLQRLDLNPYLNAKVEIKNKKDGRGIKPEDLIKSHKKITAYSLADENGVYTRYKMTSDFSAGYKAKKQIDKNHKTVISDDKKFRYQLLDVSRLNLKADEKDYRGNYINSEKNLEIVEAKQRKWFGAKKVKGFFFNGRFISEDRSVISSQKDSKGVKHSWSEYEEKELLRQRVLQISFFNHVNSKTIQLAMGYGIEKSANLPKIQSKLGMEIAEYIRTTNAKHAAAWKDKNLTKAEKDEIKKKDGTQGTDDWEKEAIDEGIEGDIQLMTREALEKVLNDMDENKFNQLINEFDDDSGLAMQLMFDETVDNQEKRDKKIHELLTQDVDKLKERLHDYLKEKMLNDLTDDKKKVYLQAHHEIKLKNTIFTEDHDKDLLERDTTKLPSEMEQDWEAILKGDNEEAKKALPSGLKAKVAFDVFRQEIAQGKTLEDEFKKEDSRAGVILNAVKDDHAALSNVSLMLLSVDNKPDYWDVAREICSKYLLTNFEKKFEGTFDSRFNRTLAKAKSKNGQMMRIALIDELNANRSHWDPKDILGALMPTRWKQYVEDNAGKRGVGAKLKQKLLDGSLLSLVSDMFTSVYDTVKDLKVFTEETLFTMGVVQQYTSAVTSCVNFGALAEVGAFAVTDLVAGDEAVKDDKTGEVMYHTSDVNRGGIMMGFAILTNTQKLIKTSMNAHKKRVKAAEEKAKQDKNYDPQPEIEYANHWLHDIGTTCVNIAVGVGTPISKFVNDKASKNRLGIVKGIIGTYENVVGVISATKARNRIKETQKDFETLMTKENKTKEDLSILEVLKENSQLQYGLSCARSKSEAEIFLKTVSAIQKFGKGVTGFFKNFVPGGKANPLVLVADAVWGTILGTVKLIGEIALDHQEKKDNIAQILGKKYRSCNRTLLGEVLRREVGISSTDYLTDLARIFMSIDTHMFMKNASTDAEKKVGEKIAQTLFNNKNYNGDTLKKMDIGKLMGVLGVQGNFHQILKHSLA